MVAFTNPITRLATIRSVPLQKARNGVLRVAARRVPEPARVVRLRGP